MTYPQATAAAVLFALLAHVAAGFRAAVQEHPGAAGGVVDGALAGGGGGGGGALAFPVEKGWAEGQVAVAGGGEKRASLLRRVMNSRSVALAW